MNQPSENLGKLLEKRKMILDQAARSIQMLYEQFTAKRKAWAAAAFGGAPTTTTTPAAATPSAAAAAPVVGSGLVPTSKMKGMSTQDLIAYKTQLETQNGALKNAGWQIQENRAKKA